MQICQILRHRAIEVEEGISARTPGREPFLASGGDAATPVAASALLARVTRADGGLGFFEAVGHVGDAEVHVGEAAKGAFVEGGVDDGEGEEEGGE